VDLSQRLRLLGVRVGKLVSAQDLTPPPAASDPPEAEPPAANLDLFPEA
jgi:hypothetical protein